MGLVAVAGCLLSSRAAGSEDLLLRDFLGRTWSNEFVQFTMTDDQQASAIQGRELIRPGGAAVTYQVVPATNGNDHAAIAFLADLDPFETCAYRFTNTAAHVVTNLQIVETAGLIRITNNLIGISIRKSLAAGEGPIEGIRLNSGAWVGGSQFSGAGQPMTSYTAEITATGPVFAEVLCRATFSGTNVWTLKVRIHANEPVVLVEESFSLGDNSSFILNLGSGLAPDHVLYRNGGAQLGQCASWAIAGETNTLVFLLEPWLHWGVSERRGQWFGLYNGTGSDLLSIGARDADIWVDPANAASYWESAINVRLDSQGPAAAFPLWKGVRRWMIGAHNKDASLTVLANPEGDRCYAPLPQKYVIKHAHFPLNRVKDYVYIPPQNEEHPRLFLTKTQAQQFRATFQADPAKLAACRANPVNLYAMEDWITTGIGTNDPVLGTNLANSAVQTIQAAVNEFLDQNYPPTFGLGNSNDKISQGANLADAILDDDQMTAELRERLRAQMAFLGYTVNRNDFWSPIRGFAANPNMTTRVASYRALLACMIPSHPQAATWMTNAMTELKDNQLDTWSDANGGWLEAPHYAMLSYDMLLGCFLMARNSGFNDFVFDPKMKAIAGWFAKISTPPDSRIKGWRHTPPVGNTYISEPSGEFSLVAAVWKEQDPAFAAQMQWMFRQQGSQPYAGVGGFYPTLAGYRTLLVDPGVPETAPAYESEQFPNVGIMLRNGSLTNRETQLLLLAGSFWNGYRSHWDDDSGSVTLWGKGRIVADDFGYYGAAPFEDHSLLDAPASRQNNIFNVTLFVPSNHFDYVTGKRGTWQRQIAFVKDIDPLAPNYFVICDTLPEPQAGTWRLWLTCSNVTINTQRALAQGKDDVDTDLFFALPGGVPLTTEVKARTTCGLDANGYQNTVTTTQIGVIATRDAASVFTTLIYPRLKTETPPVFRSLADGRGIKVESTAGTDYVFLSAKSFMYSNADVSFGGTVGSIQIRGGRTNLSLGAFGRISIGGQTLVSGIPAGFNVWTGFANDTNWMTADNWSFNHAPTNFENVFIEGAAVILTNNTPVLGSLVLTNGASLSVYASATNGADPWGLLVSVSGTVTMAGNAWIYPYSHPTNGGSVWFRCSNLVVDASSGFNANEKGYAGAPNDNASGRSGYGPGTTAGFTTGTPGPSYGGVGGTAFHSAGGFHLHLGGGQYGDYANPAEPGSGGAGGAPWTSPGGAGGGLIRVLASDAVIMDGSMLANGQAMGNSYAAPGSGGGICVQCKTIKGSGLLSAVGGDLRRGDLNDSPNTGGAGGGGRIAILYDTVAQAGMSPQPTVRLNAAGGSQNEHRMSVASARRIRGGAGSLYLSDSRFFDLRNIQGGEILAPGATSSRLDRLSVSNGFIKFPSGFSLTVTQDVTLTGMGGLDLSNAVVTVGRDFIVNSDDRAGAYFRGGPGQGLSIGRNLFLGAGWFELSAQGTTNFFSVPVGGNVTLTNQALACLYSGITNGAPYGLLVDVAGTVTVASNCWIYAYSNSTNGGSVRFKAGNMMVHSGGGIDANQKGFGGGPGNPTVDGKAFGPGAGVGTAWSQRGPGGGGYGGQGRQGGASRYAAGGSTYGSSNAPADPGSGGGGSEHAGSAGGGLIHAVIKGSVLVDGSMLANGGDLGNSYGACGSGGGIFVNCMAFKGSGVLTANGGSSGRNESNFGGSGGGGRIAVWAESINNWFGAAQADGGVGIQAGNVGANGTVVFIKKSPAGTMIMVN
jgi:hypothetical protein